MAEQENIPDAPEPRLKIYFLPNLFTAANLFCGFVALTKIVGAEVGNDVLHPDYTQIKIALGFILLACIFDLFDGRVARMAGVESPFGREFDSLADLVSFGVAPAFLVHRVVLRDVFEKHPEVGWFISSAYLLAGAFRLARFNCLASMAGSGGGKEFLGFPIPAAAGLVASLTMVMIYLDEQGFAPSQWKYGLPVLLIFLSAMMVSTVKYPTFKKLDWRTQRPFVKTLIIALLIGSFIVLWQQILPVVAPLVFTAYLVYGFIRPSISRRMQKEIEVDDDPDEGDADGADATGK